MSHLVKFSEATYIATHGMVYIASNNEGLNVDQIAEKLFSSKHHVAKIFQTLVKKGYLISKRGPTGGFHLKKKPEDISFLELYELFEGEVSIGDCPLDKEDHCPFDNKCIMEDVTKHLSQEFVKFMRSKTLAQMINVTK